MPPEVVDDCTTYNNWSVVCAAAALVASAAGGGAGEMSAAIVGIGGRREIRSQTGLAGHQRPRIRRHSKRLTIEIRIRFRCAIAVGSCHQGVINIISRGVIEPLVLILGTFLAVRVVESQHDLILVSLLLPLFNINLEFTHSMVTWTWLWRYDASGVYWVLG